MLLLFTCKAKFLKVSLYGSSTIDAKCSIISKFSKLNWSGVNENVSIIGETNSYKSSSKLASAFSNSISVWFIATFQI